MSGSPAQYCGWECRYIDISQAHDPMGRGLELLKLELELDKDGSPVSIEPRGWYIRVVPARVKHWRYPFVHQRRKHVFAMRPVGPGQWTLLEPWWHRLLTATITSEQARKVLILGARGDMHHVREAVPRPGSQVRGWMSCPAAPAPTPAAPKPAAPAAEQPPDNAASDKS